MIDTNMLSQLSANVSRHVLDWKHILPFGLSYDFKFDGLGFATLAFNNISGLGRGANADRGAAAAIGGRRSGARVEAGAVSALRRS
jgi:hypothetical protein